MKRNYLFLAAIFFAVTATFLLVATHSLDLPKRKPASAPKRVERAIPHLPHVG